MSKLLKTLDIFSVILIFERRIPMNKNKLGKSKKSINQLDANKGSSGVANTQMSIMYNISNMTGDIEDVLLEEKNSNNK